MWLNDPKTCSKETVKGSSTESIPPSLSSKSPDSFILEADEEVLANVKLFYPDEEIMTNFLSLLSGHIMQIMESKEPLKKVYISKPVPVLKEYSKEELKEKETSLQSVQIEKCFAKKQLKKRSSCKSFSKSSTFSLISKKSSKKSKISLKEESEISWMGEAEIFGEEEEKIYSEDLNYLLSMSNPKSYLSTYYMNRKLLDWTFKEKDQDVEILFKNGNRLSRMQMEGEGKFIWSDGTIYKGTFKNGQANGRGEILWPDGSWYTGDFVCNKRHGHGIGRKIFNESEIVYYGDWLAGKKHGKGMIVYGENNWYDGDWKYGRRDGFGIRSYDTGSFYCGEWSNGMRIGHGTMIWPNNDVYTGSWRTGFMQGIGRYTWRAIKNSKFVAPQLNVFTGTFFEGRRKGFGHLRLATGASIYTTWLNREKSGTGEIYCCNGKRIYARNLFFQDRAVEVNLFGADRQDLPEDVSDDIELLNLMSQDELGKRVTPRSINVNEPVQEMDFTKHIDQLFEIDYDVSLPLSIEDPRCEFHQYQYRLINDLETTWLQKVIMKRMPDLNAIYNFYATIGVDNEIPNFKIVMLRIMLYQLLRDCGIRKTTYSCVDLDEMIGIGTDAFDNILMYEMIHYLLKLCWLTRMNPRTNNKEIPGILAGTLDHFIDDVVKAMENYDGSFLKFFKFIPLKPIHKLYKTFEFPMKIEDLCERIFNPLTRQSEDEPFTPEWIMHALQGSNTVCADGTFSYAPYEEPHVDFTKESLKPEETPFADLRLFEEIGVENVIQAIKKAVPEAIREYDELDGSYKLSFLDFCDILSNLALKYIEAMEEYVVFLKEEMDADVPEPPATEAEETPKETEVKVTRTGRKKRMSLASKSLSGSTSQTKTTSQESSLNFIKSPWQPTRKFITQDEVEKIN